MTAKIIEIIASLTALAVTFFSSKKQDKQDKVIEEKQKFVQKQADEDFKSVVENKISEAQSTDLKIKEKALEDIRKILAE